MKEPQCLVFAPEHNTHGKRDATHAFQPEAEAFCKFHNVPDESYILIDNHKSKVWMRKAVLDALDNSSVILMGVMFFCHGYKSGIQFGFNKSKASVDKLAAHIYVNTWGSDPVVGLYCCSTGRDADRDKKDDLKNFGGDGGYADELRDALCRVGSDDCRVLAHTTAAHTTKNPDLREFKGNKRPLGGEGGNYIIPRKNRAEFRVWRQMLQDKKIKGKKWPEKTTFRYELPFLSTEQIQDRVINQMQKGKKS